MKTIIIQFICCILLSYTLEAFPEVLDVAQNAAISQDTIKDEDLEHRERTWDEDEWENEEREFRGININFGNRNCCDNNITRVGMLDLGISSYLHKGSLDMPDEVDYMDQRLFRSVNVGIHIVNIKLGLNKKERPQRLGVSTGVKWNIVHYSMEKDYQLNKDQPDYFSAIDYDVPPLKKNRLKANYIQIPLLLELNTNPNRPSKSFNLGIGYAHQLLLNSNYKYKTEDGIKRKEKGEYNLTKSMGIIEGRIGFGPLNFYVQYGLKDLFQKNDGPELTPINFGINIIPR